MDSCFRRNDRHLHSIVIPAEAGIHSYYPHLLRSYIILLMKSAPEMSKPTEISV